MSAGRALLLIGGLAGIAALGACDETAPTPVQPRLVLEAPDPVVARFVQSTGVLVAEFPVSVSDPQGSGGTLDFVEAVVLNRTRGTVVMRNRRPNASYRFSDRSVPAGGRLTVEAGVAFPPPPPRDEIVLTVRAGLTNGREVQRTVGVAQQF